MPKKILFSLLFIIIAFTNLYADSRFSVESNYKIRRVSPEGGLSTNGQRDVRQDKWGFIWVITVNNLYRFDGYTFKLYTYKLNNTTTPISCVFERLEIDKTGDLYVTSNVGLFIYNSIKYNFYFLL